VWNSLVSSIAEKLRVIRSRLSLDIIETAAVLRADKPAVYSWLNGHDVPGKSTCKRLASIFETTVAWHEMSPQPLGVMVRQVVGVAPALVGLLRQEDLDTACIHHHLELLAAHQREQRAPERPGLGLRKIAAKEGYVDSSLKSDLLNVATSKRISPEPEEQ
jgi:hypothetical protein